MLLVHIIIHTYICTIYISQYDHSKCHNNLRLNIVFIVALPPRHGTDKTAQHQTKWIVIVIHSLMYV